MPEWHLKCIQNFDVGPKNIWGDPPESYLEKRPRAHPKSPLKVAMLKGVVVFVGSLSTGMGCRLLFGSMPSSSLLDSATVTFLANGRYLAIRGGGPQQSHAVPDGNGTNGMELVGDDEAQACEQEYIVQTECAV